MQAQETKIAGRAGSFSGFLRRYFADRRGNVAVIMALSIVPLLGVMSMAGETASWWMYQRAAQNAADSAAIAAAINGDATADANGVARFVDEGKAAASQYGYTDGASNVTVSVNDTVACPSNTTATTCYQATITKKVPLYLTQIVGFSGDAGAGLKLITASAIATPSGGAAPPFCVIALGNATSKDLTVNGGPNSNLPGCAVGSNGAVDCHGHAITGTIASYAAAGDNNDCAANGNFQTLTSPITDPYTDLANNIPSHPCGSYGSESNGTAHLIADGANAGGVQVFCGDTELASQTTTIGSNGKPKTTTTCDTKVTLPAGTVLVIVNGTLDICSSTLDGSAGATVIFTGNKGGPAASQFISGKGTIDVAAPTSGAWDGMALYQDPNTTNVPANSITFPGNSPTFEVNGLIYTPNADVTISGVIGSDKACVGFLTHTIIINGTGNIIDAADCAPITLTGGQFSGTRVALVQ